MNIFKFKIFKECFGEEEYGGSGCFGAGDDAGGGEDAVDAGDGVGAVVEVCCCRSFWIAVG